MFPIEPCAAAPTADSSEGLSRIMSSRLRRSTVQPHNRSTAFLGFFFPTLKFLPKSGRILDAVFKINRHLGFGEEFQRDLKHGCHLLSGLKYTDGKYPTEGERSCPSSRGLLTERRADEPTPKDPPLLSW